MRIKTEMQIQLYSFHCCNSCKNHNGETEDDPFCFLIVLVEKEVHVFLRSRFKNVSSRMTPMAAIAKTMAMSSSLPASNDSLLGSFSKEIITTSFASLATVAVSMERSGLRT